MGMVRNEFNKIVRKAVVRYAKKYQVGAEDVQLLLFLNLDGTAGFKTLVKYQPKEVVTIKQIMDILIDFTGMASMTENFIQKMLLDLSRERIIEQYEINVMVVCQGDPTSKDSLVLLHLYAGRVHVTELNANEILSDEKLSMS